MICSVSGISARSPRTSGHAPRYDWRYLGGIPPPDLAAIQLLLGMIEHRIGKIRPRPRSAQTTAGVAESLRAPADTEVHQWILRLPRVGQTIELLDRERRRARHAVVAVEKPLAPAKRATRMATSSPVAASVGE
jgi:hypothetical protein